MAGKITLKEVAARAGVGTATVERVLNGRGGVKPQTVEKVIAAVRKLDYPKRVPERHRGIIRIEVILVRPESPFFDRLSKAYARIAATFDSSIAVHRTFVEEANPQAIAKRIAKPSAHRSALIVAVPEDPVIRAALSNICLAGTPVVQIVTRMAGLDTDYVGIDNEAAGRMAGLLMQGLQNRGGRVIVMCHSQVYAVHRERVRGFSDFMARQGDGKFHFDLAAFTHDNDREASERLHEPLRHNHDLVGIYNVGGANAGVIERLRNGKRGHICFIGHELTHESAEALRDGTMSAVIDQAPETQARRSLDLVLNKLGLLKTPVDRSPIRFITVTAENL